MPPLVIRGVTDGGISAADTSRIDEIDGTMVHYHDVGSGTPLLMISSTGPRPGTSAWLTYFKVLDALAPTYRCILLDLPNHGRTGPVVFEESVYDFVARLGMKLMDKLGHSRFTAVGNSQGGQIATNLALSYPDKIDKVVCGACDVFRPGGNTLIFGQNPHPGGSEVGRMRAVADAEVDDREQLRRFTAAHVYEPSLLTDQVLEEIYEMRTKLQDHWDAMRQSQAFRPSAAPKTVNDLTIPTLIIWGRYDRFIPYEQGLSLLSRIRTSELVLLNDCGHWPPFEKPREYASYVNRFLEDG